MPKAIALLSGGLDSILAIRVMLDQGVEIEALHFVSLFTGGTCSAKLQAERLGVPLLIRSRSQELLDIACDPEHGYGSQVNPCIDCRIAMLRSAHRIMKERGADFLITGEVRGQRPMSQSGDAPARIVKHAGVQGDIVRPLSSMSAFPKSKVEEQGLITRDGTPEITGRGRKPQIALAATYGITDYPAPAGGCCLTEPGFAARWRDQLARGPIDLNTAHLLKFGRHLRLSESAKLVVGRNERDNEKIATFARPGDILLDLGEDVPGPLALLRGEGAASLVPQAAAIVARYSRFRDDLHVPVRVMSHGGAPVAMENAQPAANDLSKFLL
jgi:tRNA U34 2-thiouridine synthase MnmA/TrmU